MGRKKATSQIYASAVNYSHSEPVALERTAATDQQILTGEGTIMWGDDDALPLRILQAVNQSPTAISCLGKVSDYMQGSGFTDPDLAAHVVDKDGTTLGQLHNQLCDYMSKLEGFSTRFTFDRKGDITNCYLMSMESCRFVRPTAEESRKIRQIKYNPYWGTLLYKQDLTNVYNVWEADKVTRYKEISGADPNKYNGQIYFEGTPRAPYKFYPVAKYWSGSNWIYVDGQVQSFIKKMLDNGFFQSVLINMIGDPTQPSKNPKYQVKKTGTDGVVRTDWDGVTTVGVEFGNLMQGMFSGHDKAGTAMTFWSINKDSVASIQAFPVNANFENISGTMTNAIRGVTIATEVPAILANLPQQASSLGSDGNAMRAAVELMQARVKEPQQILENFYNNVLLPNMANKTASRVKIKQHMPISNQVVVEDKVWEWMNDEEKAEFVRNNIPSVTVKRVAVVAPTPVTAPAAPGEPVQPGTPASPDSAAPSVNDALKGLKLSDINRMSGIVAKVAKGAMTYDQAKIILQGYGLTDEQIDAWLVKPEEI